MFACTILTCTVPVSLPCCLLSTPNQDTNITTCSLHPGSVVSDIPRHLPGLVRHLYPLYAHAFCKTTCKGAQTSICAAVDPRFDAVTGVYLDDCAIVPASAVACDVGVAKRLWDVSEQLTGAQWQF